MLPGGLRYVTIVSMVFEILCNAATHVLLSARVAVMQSVMTNELVSFLSCSKKLKCTEELKQLQLKGEAVQILLPSSMRPASHVSFYLFFYKIIGEMYHKGSLVHLN